MMVPDFMPRLRFGTGDTPQEGGCLIQVAGFLYDGVSWTDETPCVHPMLRTVAININDSLGDEERQTLLQFVPRLIGTGLTGLPGMEEFGLCGTEEDHRVTSALVDWCINSYPTVEDVVLNAEMKYAVQQFSSAMPRTSFALDAARTVATHAARTAMYLSSWRDGARAEASRRFLGGMLDEYDRLTGRTTTGKTVTYADWKRVTDHMTGAAR